MIQKEYNATQNTGELPTTQTLNAQTSNEAHLALAPPALGNIGLPTPNQQLSLLSQAPQSRSTSLSLLGQGGLTTQSLSTQLPLVSQQQSRYTNTTSLNPYINEGTQIINDLVSDIVGYKTAVGKQLNDFNNNNSQQIKNVQLAPANEIPYPFC
jgi:hypothetical protein